MVIRFLKTVYRKCLRVYKKCLRVYCKYSRRYYYFPQYSKYLEKVRLSKYRTFLDIEEPTEYILYISQKYEYYKEKVRWCGENLHMYAFP